MSARRSSGSLRVSLARPAGRSASRLTPLEVPRPAAGSDGSAALGPWLTLHDSLHATLSEPDGAVSRALVLPGGRSGRTARLLQLVVDGWQVTLEVEDAERARLRDRAVRGERASTAGRPAEVRAIIPGRVVGVRVSAGESVREGQTVLVLEAMKMQNEVRSPRSGTISRIAVVAGATVEAGDLLAVVE